MKKFVGIAGFEPTTACSQSKHSNRTELYPDTSRGQLYNLKARISYNCLRIAEAVGFEPTGRVSGTQDFKSRRL